MVRAGAVLGAHVLPALAGVHPRRRRSHHAPRWNITLRSRSAPVRIAVPLLDLWWLFEFANRYLDNWRYLLPRPYHPVEYALLASLAFSTVMPAIFVTAELLRTFAPFAPDRRWLRIDPGRGRTRRTCADRPRHISPFAGIPAIPVPLRLDRALPRVRSDQRAAGKSQHRRPGARGPLGYRPGPLRRGVDLRLVLGDVERLFDAEMGLPRPICRLAQVVRDAHPGLWGLFAVRPGGVRRLVAAEWGDAGHDRDWMRFTRPFTGVAGNRRGRNA